MTYSNIINQINHLMKPSVGNRNITVHSTLCSIHMLILILANPLSFIQMHLVEVWVECALYQYQNDKFIVLGYGSLTLVGAECKYHSFKLEFLALKSTICKHYTRAVAQWLATCTQEPKIFSSSPAANYVQRRVFSSYCLANV